MLWRRGLVAGVDTSRPAVQCINGVKLCSVARIRHGYRTSIIAHSKRAPRDRDASSTASSSAPSSGAGVPVSREQLQTWTKAQLMDECRYRGLMVGGNKPDLIERLADALWGAGSDAAAAPTARKAPVTAEAGNRASTSTVYEQPEQQAVLPDDGVSEEQRLYELAEDRAVEALWAETRAVLATWQYAKLVESLQERGLSASGSADTLLDRLCDAMVLEAPPNEFEALVQEQLSALKATGAATPAAAAAAAAPAASTPAAAPARRPPITRMDPEEREYLVADKQQQLLEDLAQVDSAELVGVLQEGGQTLSGSESKDQLVERVSWMLAEEEVALMEENAAAGSATASTSADVAEEQEPEAALEGASTSDWRTRNLPTTSAGAGDPNSILSSLTLRQVNAMKVSDLRQTLKALGLDDTGARYDLRDRLQTILAVHNAAMSGKSEDVVKQLSGMTIKELRAELDRRGLATHGNKGSLEARLAKAMTADLTGEGDKEDEDTMSSIQVYNASHEAPSTDPPVTIAVVVGGASPIERETSLASARTLIDAIHTAALVAPAMADASAGGEAAVTQKDGEDAEDDVHGVEVDVYMLAGNGLVYSVPSALVLSMSHVDLDAQLPALCPAPFSSPPELATHLKSSARPTVAYSLLPQSHGSAAELAQALESQGVPTTGAPAKVLETVADRFMCLETLNALGYPVLPMQRISVQDWERASGEAAAAAASDAAGADAAGQEQTALQQQEQEEGDDGDDDAPLSGAAAVIARQLTEWCQQRGWDADLDILAVAPADAPSGEGSVFARGARRAARRVEEFLTGGKHQSVMVEPYAAASMLAWSVVVVESEEDGPVALMPTQIELYDAELEMFKHKLDVAEHELMQDGTPPELIAEQMNGMAAVEPEEDYASLTSLPRPLAHRTVKFKSPPEMSLAMTQTLRHGAAKVYSDLKLRGVARISGWVDLARDWRQKYKRADEFIEPLPDQTPGVMDKYVKQMEADAALLPLPLSDYYNESLHMADLSAFDAHARLSSKNGEGTVFVSGVEVGVPIHVGSIAQQEAAEVGMSPGALARHMANVALARAGLDVQLPPERPADMQASVLWAHITGSTQPEKKEADDDEDAEGSLEPDLWWQGKMEPVIHLPDPSYEDIGLDPSKPLEELTQEIEDVLAPVPWDQREEQPPEDWEPEFDDRTQDDINAERDAELEESAPERLAWRQGIETWVNLDRHGGEMEIAKEMAAGRLTLKHLGDTAAAAEADIQRRMERNEYDEDDDEEVPAPQRPRVWVLMGGEGDERQESLRTGVNVWAKLQRFPDLLVEPFLLPPIGAGANEVARRAALLERRTTWLCNSLPEEDMPAELRLERIRNMMPPPTAFLRQLVWALPPAALARHSVEEVVESAERHVARASLSYFAMPAETKQQVDVQLEVQAELTAHYVQGIGSTWGGNPNVLPVPPRVMDLTTFVDEAAACGATVFLALHNSSHVLGPLQEVLMGCKVAFTGPGREAAMVCGSKVSLAEALADLEESGISCPPRRIIDTTQLMSSTDWAADAELLWQQLVADWDGEGSQVDALALKPAAGGSGIGVAKICNSQDLAVYAAALRQGAPSIPAGMLSAYSTTLYMPPVPPVEVVVEPWVDTDPVTVSGSQGSASNSPATVGVEWSGSSRWVEAVIGLLGDLGAMEAMSPSLVAQSTAGERCHVTPAPASVLSAEAVAGAQERAAMLAARLGLRGLAQVDCFVNADTGELIVLDVRPSPKLSDGHPLLQQALLRSPPLLPHELFREQLLLAQQAHEADMAAARSSLGAHSAWYGDDGLDGDDLADAGAADFDLAAPQLVAAGAEDDFAL